MGVLESIGRSFFVATSDTSYDLLGSSVDRSSEENYGIQVDPLGAMGRFLKAGNETVYYDEILGVRIARIVYPDLRETWYTASPPSSNNWVEIDPEQLWFWTPEWQAGEREVDEDLRSGRYEVFDNLDDFFNM